MNGLLLYDDLYLWITCIQGNSRISSVTQITQITLFLSVSRFNQFFPYFSKIIVHGLFAKT